MLGALWIHGQQLIYIAIYIYLCIEIGMILSNVSAGKWELAQDMLYQRLNFYILNDKGTKNSVQNSLV